MTTSQYFVYKRPIAWTLLVGTLIWGVYAYRSMPQRQDPLIQIRSGVVLTWYPGAAAVEVEQEVSRKIEKVMTENPAVEHVRSVSQKGQSIVFIDLYETIKNAEAIWQDLSNKLEAITDLPTVAGQPLRPKLNKDFGDTVATMLTVSSPPITNFEVEQRAELIVRKLEAARAARPEALRDRRYSGVLVHPSSVSPDFIERLARSALQHLVEVGLVEDGQYLAMLGAGVVDFRLVDGADESRLHLETDRWKRETLGAGLGHPDIWPALLICEPRALAGEMKRHVQEEPGGVARYTYEDLHRFADLIQDRLRQSPRVGKIEQIGVQEQAVFLYYSNRRLSGLGIEPMALAQQLAYRNINMPGGSVELPEQTLAIKPSGPYRDKREIGETVVDVRNGYPLYLRDLAEVVRGYEDPARTLNFRTVKRNPLHPPTTLEPKAEAKSESESGHAKGPHHTGPAQLWTTRAVTLAICHVKGTQIADFGRDVDRTLKSLEGVLPDDLQVERTSDEPHEVHRKIDLFKDCLIEAMVIVIVVTLLFMEWRSALLVALSIPITVAMTLGICALLGIDIQQISIAALIIALGLLVDDPVVAGDAINRELAHGTPRDVAAWLGPQKLARAILYATLTNIVAFLPLLLVGGGAGEFIQSLPIVVTASLVASRIVSMTFIPMLGYYMLKGQKGLESGLAEGGKGSRFARIYNGFSELCMEHKWAALASCLVVLFAAMSLVPKIGTNFFPKDLHNTFTVNLFLPEGTPIRQTKAEAMKAIAAIDKLAGSEAEAYTTFVGAGGPRFWLSVVPEQPAANYAQIMVHTHDAFATAALAARMKRELPPSFAAARVTVEQLESGPPIGTPIQIRLQGPELATLRHLGDEVKRMMVAFPGTENVHDDWDPESLQINLNIATDRANMSAITNQDVAMMTSAGLSGYTATTIRERDRQVPVILRLRPDERSRMEDLNTMQVFSARANTQVPLEQVGTFQTEMVSPKIGRRDNERCITVKCDTVPGLLPSRVVDQLETQLVEASKAWPPGYRFAFGGEKEEQAKGFAFMSVAMVASIIGIYLALVLQFNSLTKPLLVFAAVPFGMIGGLMGLLIFNVPLGFFAMLGLSSLAGVIISHVIVLFEYIEEAHERGEPLRRAVIDAALVRLRPVLVTVLATVGGLVPLAMKGGPLWEPLCCVQIIGLLVATLVTKVVVPVLYVLFVEDFKLIKWSEPGEHAHEGPPAEYLTHAHERPLAIPAT
ncbi:efflux RND transporter permease subunit [Singulisphaera acidiphila]|uniref:Cation/multidrug efflux pump n=1 Tax=Singulisphaera acidiphila (strain ATCC BAA-1392 / DSM 18658 / VKM B-2454 / MOB10) TaxID=886293 RepID=L0DHC3_SINAD|nr:efflux RND transporter permease subunit [Singulisphaera acidiphila]AGA28071.1 cation/multidrug efflux pump [Singulisphaera acidiphila DSM 18658]